MGCRVGQATWPLVAKHACEVKARHDKDPNRDGLWLMPLRFPNRLYACNDSRFDWQCNMQLLARHALLWYGSATQC